MEKNKLLDPLQLSFFGSNTVMMQSKDFAHLIEQA